MAPGKARSQLVVKGVVKARNVSVKTCPEVKLSFSICVLSQRLLSFASLSLPSVSGKVGFRRTSQRVITMGVSLSGPNIIALLIAVLLMSEALFSGRFGQDV